MSQLIIEQRSDEHPRSSDDPAATAPLSMSELLQRALLRCPADDDIESGSDDDAFAESAGAVRFRALLGCNVPPTLETPLVSIDNEAALEQAFSIRLPGGLGVRTARSGSNNTSMNDQSLSTQHGTPLCPPSAVHKGQDDGAEPSSMDTSESECPQGSVGSLGGPTGCLAAC